MNDKRNLNDSILAAVPAEIKKNYDVLDHLGGGRYTKVYLIQEKKSKELRALKILNAVNIDKTQKDPKYYIKIIEREANAYNRIKHPNIVKVFGVGIADDKKEKIEIPYLIITYIKGSNLEDKISEQEKLSVNVILKISGDILSALDTIHNNGIIHRDIKPSNIMIENSTEKAILIDFGLAKDDLNKISLRITGAPIGTPFYMSPEQCKSEKNTIITPASDIYSFGAVLFEMLTGRVPYQCENPFSVMLAHCNNAIPNIKDLNPDLPEGIENIIYKAMAKEPERRYQRAKDLFADLKEIFEKNNKEISIEWPVTEIENEEEENEEPPINPSTPRKRSKIVVISLGIIGTLVFILFLFLKIIPDIEFGRYIGSARNYAEKGQYRDAYENLGKAQRIKDNAKVRGLRAAITDKQKEAMGKAYISLTQILDVNTAQQEQLEAWRKFTDTYREVISPGINAEVKKNIAQLETGIKEDNAYQNYIAAADGYINKEDYERANDELTKAQQISKVETEEIRTRRTMITEGEMKAAYDTLQQFLQGSAAYQEKLDKCREFLTKYQNAPPTEEITAIRAETAKYMTALQKDIRADKQINGNEEYNAIKSNIILENYLSFKNQYPSSRYLPDLKARLIKADENLPPEKYWEQGLERNRKGYYELIFKENNYHRMVYIPEVHIWIDKYEVSWAQYKRFSNVQPPLGPDLYIQGGDAYPAVATYSDAESYCNRYGLRLPTATGWEFVAGKWKSDYPWGYESPDVPSFNGKWRANFLKLENGKHADGFKGTAPIDSFADFSSPFDVVNMAGNVWEWVWGEILKGGSYFSSKAEDLKISSTKQGESSNKEGFRCVKDE